ncbi:hypothetical protein QA596_12480 [Balneolales bacterium ANBcel1]|nr:hypothetical protein [Balneolales bacterium ANBcel1]
MITKSEIKDLINNAEKSYSRVAEILDSVRNKENFEVLNLFDIQPILAESLYKLSCMYSELSHEKKSYIERKSDLNNSWFTQRMRLIKKYQKVIDYTISIGKFLGDHYAWLFYNFDRKNLQDHYRHERIFYMPTGVGGLGELEYVKNVKYINNNVLIYHATTTFLRIGDVSFFDVKKSKVTSLGEIKTKKISTDELSVNLSLVGQEKDDVRIFDQVISTHEKVSSPLSPEIQGKLNHQLSKMSKLIGEKGDTKKQSIFGDFEFNKIDEIYNETTKSSVKHYQISDGLILVCFKPHQKTLFTKFFEDYSSGIKSKIKGIEKLVNQIVIPDSNYNQILLGNILNPNPNNYLLPSATPFLFWPLDSKLFKEVTFHDSVFLSIYNPAHLIEKLKSHQFEIKKEGHRFFKLSSTIGGKHLDLGRLDTYINLITHEFYTEKTVVDILLKLRDNAKEGKLPPNKKIPIDIQSSI